jgi:hypothetical protein
VREELRLLNALIGMTMDVDGWPQPLGARGFALTALQPELTPTLEGRVRKVVPEAVFQSVQRHWVLLIESKSATFDEDQATRYLAVVADDLVARAAAVEDPAGIAGIDPVYFCQAASSPELSSRVKWFNDSKSMHLPLVDYNHHRFQRIVGHLNDSELDALFEGGIHFHDTPWPTRFVPFDAESPIDEMIVPVLSELTMRLLDESTESFDAHEIATQAVPFLKEMGSETRRKIVGKVMAVVEEFRGAYLKGLLERSGGTPPTWSKTPELATKQTTTLYTMQKDYLSRKREGRKLPQQKQVEQLLDEIRIEPLD